MRLKIRMVDIMVWTVHEWVNQLKHFFVGLIATYGVKVVFNIVDWRLLLVGLSIGLGVEVYQYFFRDNKILHPLDRIRDVTFYEIGSLVIWII